VKGRELMRGGGWWVRIESLDDALGGFRDGHGHGHGHVRIVWMSEETLQGIITRPRRPRR
jgi:hypothetical protein